MAEPDPKHELANLPRETEAGIVVELPRGPRYDAAHYRHELSSLFQQHKNKLVRFVSLKVGNRNEAEEIAQDAFLRLWQRERLKPDENIKGLLYITARNLASDRLRQSKRRSSNGVVPWVEEQSLSPEEILSSRQQLDRLFNILSRLPPKCRHAFISVKLEERSYSEIAAEMRLTESMVRKYVLRALAFCATWLEAKDGR
jgi:RNA polymerase sigma-70 factor (ECF subfamily)